MNLHRLDLVSLSLFGLVARAGSISKGAELAHLAVGAANLMHVVDPDGVCFAGGMTAAGEPFLEKIRRYVRDVAFPVPAAKCEIRYAQLGSDAGFIGAAGCARQLWLSQRGR